jgi:hypothetical protein
VTCESSIFVTVALYVRAYAPPRTHSTVSFWFADEPHTGVLVPAGVMVLPAKNTYLPTAVMAAVPPLSSASSSVSETLRLSVRNALFVLSYTSTGGRPEVEVRAALRYSTTRSRPWLV